MWKEEERKEQVAFCAGKFFRCQGSPSCRSQGPTLDMNLSLALFLLRVSDLQGVGGAGIIVLASSQVELMLQV